MINRKNSKRLAVWINEGQSEWIKNYCKIKGITTSKFILDMIKEKWMKEENSKKVIKK